MSAVLGGLAMGLGQGLVGAYGGQQQPDPKNAGDVHLANMGQQNLWNSLYGRVMSGSGDFGAGQGIKQGKSQLAQFMNDRGINPQSGAGMGMYSNMVGQAQAGANQNRLGYAMDLLRTPLQTVQTSGSNWLPNSPSFGYGADEQWKHFAGMRRNNFTGRGADNLSGARPPQGA